MEKPRYYFIGDERKADLDFEELGFDYLNCPYRFEAVFQHGFWRVRGLLENHEMTITEGSQCLHYGQQLFEGMKAQAGLDGKVYAFRPYDNARRMNEGARYFQGPEIPPELFVRGIEEVVAANYPYDRDDTGQLTYLHWDTNEAFGSFRYGLDQGQDPHEIGPLWLPSAQDPNDSLERPLMEQIWAVPEYRKTYLRILAAMLREDFTEDQMWPQIETLADRIRPHVYQDTKKPYTNDDFEKGLTVDTGNGRDRVYGLLRFVQSRFTSLDPQLDQHAEAIDIRINEVMTSNLTAGPDEHGDYDSWIELYNLGPGRVALDQLTLSNDPQQPAKWRLPAQELDDGRHIIVWIDGEDQEGPLHANFRLWTSGGNLYLYSGTELIDSINYPALEGDHSLVRLPDGTGDWFDSDQPTMAAANLGSSQTPALFINEFMAENDTTIVDPNGNGGYPDWIEIYNAEDQAIDLGGMYLSDNLDKPTKFRIPDGVTIEAGGLLLFWADNDPDQGPTHCNFKLEVNGDEIGLFDSDELGNRSIDVIRFDEQNPDVSMGRSPDGAPDWRFFSNPSPGESNASRVRNGGGTRVRP